MPCTYYTAEEEASLARGEATKLKKELDRVTDLLCRVTKFIYNDYRLTDKVNVFDRQITDLASWYDENCKMDENRIKDSIKKKLTQEELDFLKSSSLT